MKKERTITIKTLNKVKDFLKKQTEPIYITDICKQVSLNRASIDAALKIIKHKINKEGKISVRKK